MAVVDDAARAAAVQSRLDALEADNEAGDAFGLDDSDDEEFVMGEGGSDDGERRALPSVSSAMSTLRHSAAPAFCSLSAARFQATTTRLCAETLQELLSAGPPDTGMMAPCIRQSVIALEMIFIDILLGDTRARRHGPGRAGQETKGQRRQQAAHAGRP